LPYAIAARIIAWLAVTSSAESAQDEPSQGGGGGDIIPRPSEGRAPETPGDPGGWQQLTLLAVIVIAVAVILYLVRRQVKQAQRLRDLT